MPVKSGDNVEEKYEDVVSLEEMKKALRITHAEEDELIKSLIGAATGIVEQLTSKVLLKRTLNFLVAGKMINFSCSIYDTSCPVQISLPMSPVQKVDSVVVICGQDEVHVDAYKFINTCAGPKLLLNSYMIDENSVVDITYTAGFKSTEEVPAPLKVAVMMIAESLYKERDYLADPGISKNIQSLIRPYRKFSV